MIPMRHFSETADALNCSHTFSKQAKKRILHLLYNVLECTLFIVLARKHAFQLHGLFNLISSTLFSHFPCIKRSEIVIKYPLQECILFPKNLYIFSCTFFQFQAEDSVDDDVLNSFCWMYSSFDMPASFTGQCTRKSYVGTHLYNTYYQWVPIFLSVQAGIFYIPRCIWLMIEGGLMAYIVKGIGKGK